MGGLNKCHIYLPCVALLPSIPNFYPMMSMPEIYMIGHCTSFGVATSKIYPKGR